MDGGARVELGSFGDCHGHGCKGEVVVVVVVGGFAEDGEDGLHVVFDSDVGVV